MNKYIEINSTYRDRNIWPNPAEFEIPISQTGSKSSIAAIDPISYATPIHVWTSNYFNVLSGESNPEFIEGTIGINPTSPPDTRVLFTSTPKTFVVIFDNTTDIPQKLENYYTNAVLKLFDTSGLGTTILDQQRIVSSKYLGNDIVAGIGNHYVQITLFKDLNNNIFTLHPDTAIRITDPTDFLISSPKIFVPNGRLGANSYYNCYLYNESLNESPQQYVKITDYDSITHLLSVETPLPGTWLATHNYCIRKQTPNLTDLSALGLGQSTNFVTIDINVPVSVSSFIRIMDNSGPPPTGKYIYDENGNVVVDGIPAPVNEIVQIVRIEKDNATNTQTLYLYPQLSAAPTVAEHYLEILSFSRDNYNPFFYNGSLVSQQNTVCYDISIVHILLPNKILNAEYGDYIRHYPFIYVTLSNVSSASASSNLIYSNNPNSRKAVFRLMVEDKCNDSVSNFVKFKGNMTQTMKFKPNDSLYFKVTLPNGSLFDTKIEEQFSPLEPNALKQISAIFLIKRLSN